MLTNDDKRVFLDVSQRFFAMYGFTGTSLTPWHDNPAYLYVDNTEKVFNDLSEFLKEIDVDSFSYAVLCNALTFNHLSYDKFSHLYLTNSLKSWVKKLRTYAKSKEIFSDVAKFIMRFFELQVETKGVAYTSRNIVTRDVSSKGLYAEAFHVLADRIIQFRKENIDPIMWLEAKFKKCWEAWNDNVSILTIIRYNSIDPDTKALKAQLNDDWFPLRKFLGVSMDCAFPDGYIPKGWLPVSDDPETISEVRGNGFYTYPGGATFRGKFHYMKDLNFIIRATPENFEEFKEDWRNIKMLMAMPTWDEYSSFGNPEKFWDSDGKSVNGRGVSVSWRKK